MEAGKVRAALAGAATFALVAAPAAGAQQPSRTTLRGSTPRWAQPRRDRGAADGGQQVSVKVFLPLRDAQGAQALAAQISDPASAQYGKYLTPGQFNSRFAPAAGDAQAVSSFLTQAGLDVVGSDTHAVEATGTLAKAARAFGTEVHRYAYRGRVLNAPASPLTVPRSLAGKVVAVTGLDQAGTLISPKRDHDTASTTAAPDAPPSPPRGGSGGTGGAPPPDAFVNAGPCSAYFGEKTATQYPADNGQKVPFAPCGYTPAQYQSAYGLSGPLAHGTDGRGVTVAITDAYAAPTILQDANQYATAHGQQPFRSGQFRQIEPKKGYRYGYSDRKNGDLCGEQGWYGEETLDVEAVHATAPGANVVYVAGRSCDDPDLLDALNTIVDGHLADIVSNSWGSTGEDMAQSVLNAYEQTFTQATLEGIGMFFSSGDDGDESANTIDGKPVVDFPSSDPLVTAVGGTSLAVGKQGQYLFETGWATGRSALSSDGTSWTPAPPGDFLYGAGGGVSSLFAQPAYQQGVVPASIANGHRTTPDIAMDGDPNTGMLVGETQTFPDGSVKYAEYRIGGTSLASPLYAGIEALADQAAGHPHGFANPAIYKLAGSDALRDVSGPGPVPGVARVDYVNGVDGTDGTSVTLRTLDDEAQSIHTGAGYDTITGVGTPNGAAYVGALGR